MEYWELIPVFFFVAMAYASAGFGGGSTYLAVLALYGLPFGVVRMLALMCNIVVVGGGSVVFHRYIRWRKVLPLIATSVPMAFLGGLVRIRAEVFFVVLAATLLIAAAMLILVQPSNDKQLTNRDLSTATNALLGAVIGFLSGMVGIGGGIFLAPILHFMRWDEARVVAATASLFILVNSLAGLAGQAINKSIAVDLNWMFVALLLVSVLVGGQLGSRLSALKLPARAIRSITAALIAVVAIRLVIEYVPQL